MHYGGFLFCLTVCPPPRPNLPLSHFRVPDLKSLTEPTDLFKRLHCRLVVTSAVTHAPLKPFTLAAAAERAFLV